MQKNILITGTPKSGKSTILNKIIRTIDSKVGLVANEILSGGERVGFEAEVNSGESEFFSHVDFLTSNKVSKYYVDVTKLESILTHINNFSEADTLYVDEVGQMQLFSEKFKELVLDYLNSPNTCLVTISKVFDHDFISDILNRDDVILIEIIPNNREKKELFIKNLLKKIDKAKGYVKQPNRFARKDDAVILTSEYDTRTLNLKDGTWRCSCDFFPEQNICSYSIAAAELFN